MNKKFHGAGKFYPPGRSRLNFKLHLHRHCRFYNRAQPLDCLLPSFFRSFQRNVPPSFVARIRAPRRVQREPVLLHAVQSMPRWVSAERRWLSRSITSRSLTNCYPIPSYSPHLHGLWLTRSPTSFPRVYELQHFFVRRISDEFRVFLQLWPFFSSSAKLRIVFLEDEKSVNLASFCNFDFFFPFLRFFFFFFLTEQSVNLRWI